MGGANLSMGVAGIDKTGAAFRSIKNRAAATGAQIRSMLGGALAAAGAYLGLRSIKGGIDELGHLSDVAMKTSTSVDELTQAATAMSVLGIQNMGIEQLAKSFDYMAKTTGRTGMAGFYQTIGEIGKVEDIAQRAQMAMNVFGRSGMEFMPLLNAANKSVSALKNVAEAMPKVSQAAADAGDDIADGLSIVTSQFKGLWLDAIGKVASYLSGSMPKSFRQSMAIIMTYADYYAHSVGDILSSWWLRVTRGGGFFTAYANDYGALIGGTYEKLFGSGGIVPRALLTFEEYLEGFWKRTTRGFGLFTAAANATGAAIGGTYEKLFGSGGSWSDVGKGIAEGWKSGWRDYNEELQDAQKRYSEERKRLGESHISWGDVWGNAMKSWHDGMKEYEDEQDEIYKRMEKRAEKFASRIIAAENLEDNYRNAAISIEQRKEKTGGNNDLGDKLLKNPQIRNDLITSVNEANRIAMLGPQLQSETKKQTEILSKVEAGVREVADAVRKIEIPEAING